MSARRGTPHVLAVARGDEPADLLLTGGGVFVPGTREWVDTDLAVVDGVIAGWGPREAREVADVSGAALTPGFIDAHSTWSRPSSGSMSLSGLCYRMARRRSPPTRTRSRTYSASAA